MVGVFRDVDNVSENDDATVYHSNYVDKDDDDDYVDGDDDGS